MTTVWEPSTSVAGAAAVRFTPEELATRLGQPQPTAEQSRAIGAPLAPGVIVAGAGSGKTETMAARVVWLVANGLVRPEQILGLTFTRKAARELGARERRRLAQLAARGLLDGSPARAGSSPHGAGARDGQGGDDQGTDLLDGDPVVATYDSFAGRIVTEHALRLGREPAARLITEAVAWQYATRVVESYDGPMDAVAYAPSTVAEKVLALHGELAGHLVEPGRVRQFALDLRSRVDVLPTVPRMQGPYYANVRDVLDKQDARAELLPLVEAFRARKTHYEAVDFADQAELAATLAVSFPEVGTIERERYAVVLLDEYQDTSHAQLVLLRSLFGEGHPVTAVGDPCQSIYGWRGASAGTLTAFRLEFADRDATPARLDSLTTSFRNGARILTVANTLAEPLRAAGLDVPVLSPFSVGRGGGNGGDGRDSGDGAAARDGEDDAAARDGGDDAGRDDGNVVVSMHSTADDEAADVARRARMCWDGWGSDGERAPSATGAPPPPRPSIAVLVRNRSQIPRLDAALRAAGLPVEVVGVGGLLVTPEVADVVATLRVLSDPTRGDALMRLLTGSRWRIGPRDLDALARAARRLARGDGVVSRSSISDDVVADLDEVDDRSIIDALDALPGPKTFSAEGHRRLSALASQLRALRRRAGQPLPDLVHDVERTLGLDVEVAARADETGRANLDRFLDVTSEFAASGEDPTLSAFLGYLDAAEAAERGLRPGEVEVSGDRVQVLTVHGAKGLEWDAVFVTGLVDKIFPAGASKDKAWLSDPGQLPYQLRGDTAALPVLRLEAASDQRDAKEAVERFEHDCGAAGRLEERRLAYVAVTRARQLLSCSGYWWANGKGRAREPSEFLTEIRVACEAGAGEVAVWVDGPGESNPLADQQESYVWPYDPLGLRRAVVADGADLVRAAISGDDIEDLLVELEITIAAEEWDDEVDKLIAERERVASGRSVEVAIPEHMSVSQLVLLRDDPSELARMIRRPVPRAPAPLARRGTLFHTWLETRWGTPRLLDPDELPGSADEGAAPDEELVALQEAFLASEWAGRTPVEVEPPFELFIAGVAIRGRVDAVFIDADGRLDVVDWKTGRPPKNAGEQAVKAIQLAAYRLAFARLKDVPLDQVGAAFHHVRENLTLRPVDLLGEAELDELIRSVPASRPPLP